MRTRREQVQAHRFVIRRIVSAMLSGEPEAVEQPMRRLALALLGSTMVAAIVLAAAGIVGLLTDRSSPLEANTLVVEDGTRTTYIYVDDVLYPVLNYVSARLIIGAANPTERSMSQQALAGIPRGPTLGIVGAPVSLPEPDLLADLPWRVCSLPPEPGIPAPTTTAVIGADLAGGTPLEDRGLYVTHEEQPYLLWNDLRLAMSGRSVPTVLGLADAAATPVGTQLLNTVTAGPDLAVPQVPRAGARSDFVIAGQEAVVGRVFRAANQFYVLTVEGLVPVGDLAAALRNAGGLPVEEISPEAAGRALAPEGRRLVPEGFPQQVPDMHDSDGTATVCAVYRGDGEADSPLATTVEVFADPPAALASPASQSVDATQTGQDVVATVDRVLTDGGRGALVRAVPTAGVDPATATVYLITADGIRYPVPEDALGSLGYGEVDPVSVPVALVEMIPLGPTLDPATAGMPVRGQPDAGPVAGTGAGDGG